MVVLYCHQGWRRMKEALIEGCINYLKFGYDFDGVDFPEMDEELFRKILEGDESADDIISSFITAHSLDVKYDASFDEIGRYPNTRREFLPQLCNQCDNPACVPVCPVKATWKDDNGVVVIDKSKCIGCGACVKACPYGDRFLDPVKKKADKCDFCFRRIEQGLQPACVETCVGGARIFGDLADPASQVSQLASSKDAKVLNPGSGTRPQVFYIGLDHAIEHTPVH